MGEDKIIVYYVGVSVTVENIKRGYEYVTSSGERLIFSKKIMDVPVGCPIKVIRTDDGIRGPFTRVITHMHENTTEWVLKDSANRKILRIMGCQGFKTNEIKEFERILDKITFKMSKNQKQLFLMKYLLDIK